MVWKRVSYIKQIDPVFNPIKINSYILDCLIDNQTGNIWYFDFSEGSISKAYVNIFDKQPGSKAIRSPFLDRQFLGFFLLKNVKLRFQ